ncbi:ROK family protein [Psychromonas arctica]|uniref:ROK family protein n=1 Tax=Psychromonas arctica TaxID=168275 RepID=UPI00041C1C64|nr:ROK family protein [Psychromonas arctica]
MNKKGLNSNDIKQRNKLSILKSLATKSMMSRSELSIYLRLTKMTLSNLAQEMINDGLITESRIPSKSYSTGRKPINLQLSSSSPVVCGISIRRDLLTTVVADLSGCLIYKNKVSYPYDFNNDNLTTLIFQEYNLAVKNVTRKIVGIGVSSIGPLNEKEGIILSPPEFGRIKNLNIREALTTFTSLPVFLINDANAAALAEKLYGIGRDIDNYVYVHLMNGIGAGLVLNNKVQTGNTGQGGEIGHTSINFNGPDCSCGNKGCLDYYTNISNMRASIVKKLPTNPTSLLASQNDITLSDIINATHQNDPLAITILSEFCDHLSCSIINTLSLIDCDFIIIGYDKLIEGNFIEKYLYNKLSTFPGISKHKNIKISYSYFGSEAPIIGAISIVSENIFNGVLTLN